MPTTVLYEIVGRYPDETAVMVLDAVETEHLIPSAVARWQDRGMRVWCRTVTYWTVQGVAGATPSPPDDYSVTRRERYPEPEYVPDYHPGYDIFNSDRPYTRPAGRPRWA